MKMWANTKTWQTTSNQLLSYNKIVYTFSNILDIALQGPTTTFECGHCVRDTTFTLLIDNQMNKPEGNSDCSDPHISRT